MEGWTEPTTYLPPDFSGHEASFFYDSTSTFFHPVESTLSSEDQLRRWAQLQRFNDGQEQNCQEPYFDHLQLPQDPADMGRRKQQAAPVAVS